MEIKFYDGTHAEPLSLIPNRMANDIPPPNEIFEYGYPHSYALLQFCLKLEPHKTAWLPIKCDISKISENNYTMEILFINATFQPTLAFIKCII